MKIASAIFIRGACDLFGIIGVSFEQRVVVSSIFLEPLCEQEMKSGIRDKKKHIGASPR